MKLDTVYKQEVMVPHWVRGEKEYASIQSTKMGFAEVPVTALGMSIGTKKAGVLANVVEILDFEQLAEMGRAKIEGKIVFYNRWMPLAVQLASRHLRDILF